MIRYNSPNEVNELLRARGLVPSKRFGQNFLINPQAKQKLLDETLRSSPRRIWEIGPGLGTLTSSLVDECGELTLFEIDTGFIRLLEEQFADREQMRIVSGDFVQTWQTESTARGFPDVIVGNLPYNSAAKIILELFAAAAPSKLVFTVQKEMADRIRARTGTGDYSSFSIICQIGWDVRSLGSLKPGSFHPRPHVDSEMIVLENRKAPMACDRDFLLSFCRCLFAARRKTVRNNLIRCGLLNGMTEAERIEIAESCGAELSARSEDFPINLVVRIAEAYSRAIF